MKTYVWNCRGLGGPSTISQLKKTLRSHLPDLVFICRTKNKKLFVQTVCKKLTGLTGWEIVEPAGFCRGLLLGWSNNCTIKHLVSTDFCMEVEFELSGEL